MVGRSVSVSKLVGRERIENEQAESYMSQNTDEIGEIQGFFWRG